MGYKRATNKMKKSIFALVALIVATFADAQISLEHQLNGDIRLGTGIQLIDHCFAYSGTTRAVGIYYCDVQENQIIIYDAIDYSIVKSISIPANSFIALVSKGIFTTDNKWAYVLYQQTDEPTGKEWSPYYYSMKIITEDGNVLANNLQKTTLEGGSSYLLKINDSYKLAVENNTENTYDIYSLPGNGETQAISTLSSPKRSARKIAREGQVLVQTDNNTYTLTGVEAK